MTPEQQWLLESGEDASFLMQCTEAGLSLHKLDENTSVLIYRGDIPKLSGYAPIGGSHGPIAGDISQYVEERINKSRACYELRKQGFKWMEVSSKVGVHASNAVTLAKNYALAHGEDWPIGV